MQPEQGKEVKRLERVISQNFGLLEFKRNRWFYELPEAQTKEDLLRPEFWADKVEQVRGPELNRGIGDRIEFDKPDTGWAGTARISAIGPGFMKISFFEENKPEAVEIPAGSYDTRWNVGKRCHEVIRKKSGDVMASGFQQKSDAAKWISEHVKDMAA